MPTDPQPRCGGKRQRGLLAQGDSEHPLVTIITAVFNGQKKLAGCLESVLRQDYPNLEHIVLDGASTDGTIDILQKYNDKIACWKSEPDRGVYDAWNKGLAMARGEWIAFLGSDDEFLPGAITAYMALARKNPDAEHMSSQVKWIHPSGHIRIIGGPWEWPRFGKYMCTAHVGSMHRRRLYDSVGTYDTSYRIVADYELLLRPRARLKTAYMPVTTVMMSGGGISDSRAALVETLPAKIKAGGRPVRHAVAEHLWAILKLSGRNAFYHVKSRLVRTAAGTS